LEWLPLVCAALDFAASLGCACGLARACDHIPDPARHRTLFYAFHSSRARGARAKEKALLEGVPAEPARRLPRPRDDRNLAFLLPEIHANMVHG